MLAACAASPHDHSPYAGQQDRSIKALSEQDVAGYRTGAGMGLAKAAELNGYPGPMHSLESAKALGLTSAQQEELGALMRAHKEEARHLGAEVIRLDAGEPSGFAPEGAPRNDGAAHAGAGRPVPACPGLLAPWFAISRPGWPAT